MTIKDYLFIMTIMLFITIILLAFGMRGIRNDINKIITNGITINLPEDVPNKPVIGLAGMEGR